MRIDYVGGQYDVYELNGIDKNMKFCFEVLKLVVAFEVYNTNHYVR